VNDLYTKALEDLAKIQKDRISSYFTHPGEKGRLHEHIVWDLIVKICPKKYSIGTGFIINSYGEMSSQCDIVIYDDFHNRPLFGDMAANIYPIECVYATVEVKTNINTANFRKSLDNIKFIREMAKKGKHYKSQELFWQPTEAGYLRKQVAVESTVVLPPRSFIFSFETSLPTDTKELEERLREECHEEHRHFHGLLMLDRNIFATRLPNQFDPPEFRIEDNGLKAFFRRFQKDILYMPMGPLDLDRYL
jgi:hypothetical protein